MEGGEREEDVLQIAKVILKNSHSSSDDYHQTREEEEVQTERRVASSGGISYNKGKPSCVDISEDTVYSDNILQKSQNDDDLVGQDESELSDDLVGHSDNEHDDLVGHGESELGEIVVQSETEAEHLEYDEFQDEDNVIQALADGELIDEELMEEGNRRTYGLFSAQKPKFQIIAMDYN